MEILDIINKNLVDINHVQAGLQECRLAHIRDKAEYLIAHCTDNMFFTNDAFREIYNGAKNNLRENFIDEAMEDNIYPLLYSYNDIADQENIYLCRTVMSYFKDDLFSIPECFSEKLPVSDQNKIAYLKNSYTDSAYRIFSNNLSNATVTYCPDFTGVCEDVYYNRANLCILPIENSIDGKLASFKNLIRKYELKIVLTCSVDTTYNNYTKFALLKKNIEEITLINSREKSNKFFEFSINLPTPSQLKSILSAAEYFSLILYKIDSMPVSYSEKEYTYDVIFLTDNADIHSFICYMFLEAPQFIPIGYYSHMEKTNEI